MIQRLWESWVLLPLMPARGGDVFAVIYQWRVHPGREEQFVDGWNRVTRAIQRSCPGLPADDTINSSHPPDNNRYSCVYYIHAACLAVYSTTLHRAAHRPSDGILRSSVPGCTGPEMAPSGRAHAACPGCTGPEAIAGHLGIAQGCSGAGESEGAHLTLEGCQPSRRRLGLIGGLSRCAPNREAVADPEIPPRLRSTILLDLNHNRGAAGKASRRPRLNAGRPSFGPP